MSPTIPCADCASPLAAGQRYCLECGARSGPARPAPVTRIRGAAGPPATVASAAPAASILALPGPRASALLALAMLVSGFAVGALSGPERAVSAPSAPRGLILLTQAPGLGALPDAPAAPIAVEAAAEVTAPEAAALPVAPDPVVDAPEATPVAPPPATEEGDEPLLAPPVEPAPGTATAPKLPPVEHVWVISLADRGLATTFGPGGTDPYIRDVLVREGALLNNFHATAKGTPANGIAQISGQGANAATDADCATPGDVAPGTVATGDDGVQQVEGEGCVYPTTVATLPEQLTGAGKEWRAYVEEIRPGGRTTAPGCEASRSARNPFAFFKALTDDPKCPTRIVGTDALAGDLADEQRLPALSWIVPDPCHDGRDTPCGPDAPAGLPAASAWLRPVLDKIRATKAYAEGGLIVLLADRAPDGPDADRTARKGAPADQGGGLVPALLLSPFVTPGQQIAAAYDHFSLLASLEDLFELPRIGQAARPGLRSFGPRVFAAFDPAAP